MTHFNAGTETPGTVIGLGLVHAGIVKTVEFLFIATCLQHEVGIGALVVHPRGIQLPGVFLKRTRGIADTKPLLIGVTVAERAAQEPSAFFVCLHEMVKTDVHAIDFLLEAAQAGAAEAVLLGKRLGPKAILRTIANFAKTSAEIFKIGIISESHRRRVGYCDIVLNFRRDNGFIRVDRRINWRIIDPFINLNKVPVTLTNTCIR